MSGVLSCEEGDYNTAYSYFLESFEGFANVNGNGKQVMCVSQLFYRFTDVCDVIVSVARVHYLHISFLLLF